MKRANDKTDKLANDQPRLWRAASQPQTALPAIAQTIQQKYDQTPKQE
jgi:hypothetical protein